MVTRRPRERGEVWWAAAGGKSRPVVVVTRGPLVPHLTALMVVPCTTTLRNVRSEVALGVADGLPQDCVANTMNVTSLPLSAFERRIGALHPDRLAELCRALGWATG